MYQKYNLHSKFRTAAKLIKTQNVKSTKCAPGCVPKYTLNGSCFPQIRLFPEKKDFISLNVT